MKRLDLLFVPFGLLISLGLSGTAGAQTESRDRRPAIPVHEAYLPPKLEEVAARTSIPPPRSIASMAEPKSGDSAIWINGYWDFDAATQRFVWVEGVWRVAPPGRFWVVGYWAQSASGGYERVAGYWADERRGSIEFSGPPAARPAENPGVSPGADRFYIAGHYEPKERGVGVVWKPGYWSKMQSGWSWIPAAWLKRPAGWAFQEGYWIQTDRLSDPPRGGRAISMTPSETERLARLQGIASARARALTIDPNGPRSVLNDVTSSMNSVLNVAPGGLLRPNNNLAPNNRSRLPGGGYEMLTPTPGTGRDGVGTQIPAPTYYIGHSAWGELSVVFDIAGRGTGTAHLHRPQRLGRAIRRIRRRRRRCRDNPITLAIVRLVRPIHRTRRAERAWEVMAWGRRHRGRTRVGRWGRRIREIKAGVSVRWRLAPTREDG